MQEHCRGGGWWSRGGGLHSASRLTAQRAHHSQNLRGCQATPYLFIITIYTGFTVCFSVTFAHHTAPFSEPAWLPGNDLFFLYHMLSHGFTVCYSVTFCFFVRLNTGRPIFNIHVWIRKSVYLERLYCKRPIQCLAASKILTPHRPASVCVPPRLLCGGRTHSLVGEGGGGSIFWKTPDTALYSTCKCFVPV